MGGRTMSRHAKLAGFLTGLTLLCARILERGYDGLALTLTFVLIGILIGPLAVAAIDDSMNTRIFDPRPLPGEERR